MKTTKTTPKFKLEKGQLLASAEKANPGPGAIEFALQYIEDITDRQHILEVAHDLEIGNFEGVDDKRVRRCAYCGYYFRDKTRGNVAKTCSSDVCGAKKDRFIQKYKRKIEAAAKPKKLTARDIYYCTTDEQGNKLEYPFWANEYEMMKQTWKYESLMETSDVEIIIAEIEKYHEMGGRKKKVEEIDYKGTEKVTTVRVKFPKGDRTSGPVVATKRSRTEIEADILERHGARKLEQERRRAEMYGEFAQYYRKFS